MLTDWFLRGFTMNEKTDSAWARYKANIASRDLEVFNLYVPKSAAKKFRDLFKYNSRINSR